MGPVSHGWCRSLQLLQKVSASCNQLRSPSSLPSLRPSSTLRSSQQMTSLISLTLVCILLYSVSATRKRNMQFLPIMLLIILQRFDVVSQNHLFVQWIINEMSFKCYLSDGIRKYSIYVTMCSKPPLYDKT